VDTVLRHLPGGVEVGDGYRRGRRGDVRHGAFLWRGDLDRPRGRNAPRSRSKAKPVATPADPVLLFYPLADGGRDLGRQRQVALGVHLGDAGL
jgi:hypothetical protein